MAIERPLKINLVTGEIERFSATDTVFDTNLINALNNSGAALPIGTPVYASATVNEIEPAQANALATARVLGLVADVSIADTATGYVLTDGRLIATTTQWDAITGQVGGLTPGAKYYLSPTTAGRLTTTVPTADGQVLAPVGTARSTTEFEVSIERLIQL